MRLFFKHGSDNISVSVNRYWMILPNPILKFLKICTTQIEKPNLTRHEAQNLPLSWNNKSWSKYHSTNHRDRCHTRLEENESYKAIAWQWNKHSMWSMKQRTWIRVFSLLIESRFSSLRRDDLNNLMINTEATIITLNGITDKFVAIKIIK